MTKRSEAGLFNAALKRATDESQPIKRRVGALAKIEELVFEGCSGAVFDHELHVFDDAVRTLAALPTELDKPAVLCLVAMGALHPEHFIQSSFEGLNVGERHTNASRRVTRAVEQLLVLGRLPTDIVDHAAAHALVLCRCALEQLPAPDLSAELASLVASIGAMQPNVVQPHVLAISQALLRWRRDPCLPHEADNVLFRAFRNMGTVWRNNLSCTAQLLTDLCGAVEHEPAAVAQSPTELQSMRCYFRTARIFIAVAQTLPADVLIQPPQGLHPEDVSPFWGALLSRFCIALLSVSPRALATLDVEYMMDCLLELTLFLEHASVELCAVHYAQLADMLLQKCLTTTLSFSRIAQFLSANLQLLRHMSSNIARDAAFKADLCDTVLTINICGGALGTAASNTWSYTPIRQLRLCADAAIVSLLLETYSHVLSWCSTATQFVSCELSALIQHENNAGMLREICLDTVSERDAWAILVFDLCCFKISAERCNDSVLRSNLATTLAGAFPEPSVFLTRSNAVSSMALLGTAQTLRAYSYSESGLQQATALSAWYMELLFCAVDRAHRGPSTQWIDVACRAREMIAIEFQRACANVTDACRLLRASHRTTDQLDDTLLNATALVYDSFIAGDYCTFLPDAARLLADDALTRLSHPTQAVRQNYLAVLLRWRACCASNGSDQPCKIRRRLFHSLLKVSTPKLAIVPAVFRRFMEFVSADVIAHGSEDWMVDAYLVLTTPGCENCGQPQTAAVTRNMWCVSQWCAKACAQFCVASRLRTHFGNAKQTLSAIQRAVERGASVSPFENQRNKQGTRSLDIVHLRVLVGFIEQLEMQMCAAIRLSKSDDSIPKGKSGISSSTASFFGANERVIDDWLRRIRQHLVSASAACGAVGSTIRHAFLRLIDIQQDVKAKRSKDMRLHQVQYDLDACLHPLCSALKYLHDSDAIKGLASFSSAILNHARACDQSLRGHERAGMRVPWLNALHLQACGRYEDALYEYNMKLRAFNSAVENSAKASVQPSLRSDKSSYTLLDTDLTVAGVQQITNGAVECFMALGDWESLDNWLHILESTREKARALAQGHASGALLAALEPLWGATWIRSCILFETGKPDVAHELCKCQIQSAVTPALADVNACIQLSERFVMQSCLESGGEKSMDKAEQLIFGPLSVAALDAPSLRWVRPLLDSLQCIQAVRTGSVHHTKARSRVTGIPLQLDGGMYYRLLRIHDQNARKRVISSSQFRLNAVRQLINTAQNRGNLKLVGRLLTENATDENCFGLEKVGLLRKGGSAGAAALQLCHLICHLRGKKPLLGDIEISRILSEKDSNTASCSEHSATHTPHLTAKVLLQLSQSLQRDCDSLIDDSLLEPSLQMLKGDVSQPLTKHDLSDLAERCLATAVLEASDYALVWRAWGNWCYEHAVQHRAAQGTEEEKTGVDCVATSLHSACYSYFRFLHQVESDVDEVMSIGITLRLLRMLVKHGPQLQDCFVVSMQETPLAQWHAITPQLLAHIDHPHPFVAGQVQGLLMRIAVENPNSLVYEAAARTTAQHVAEEDAEQTGVRGVDRLKSALKQSDAVLLNQVTQMIQEMTRITILWDEELLFVMHEASKHVMQHVKTLARENEQLMNNLTLSAADQAELARKKFTALMQRPRAALQAFWTSHYESSDGNDATKETLTPHEQECREKYRGLIQAALGALQMPASAIQVQTAVEPFFELLRALEPVKSRASVELAQTSPGLKQGKTDNVAMPGLRMTRVRGDAVTIASIRPSVRVLATKNKPKKLIMIGSDGLQYTYLLKGNEDLHLDERIMQLLRVLNKLFAGDRGAASRSLCVRNYAVIPMSRTAGLIQWVEGAAPLFGLVTRDKSLRGEPKASPAAEFYAALAPALQKRGMQANTPRKQWPLDVMLNVFRSLRAESPSRTLEMELWRGSANAADWWERSTSYCRSLAAMSFVGFVLGLGDRHLDNILLDMNTGEIIHIDYNVCFDRGLRLRVPEIVPFRLTQVLAQALGATSTEGRFRAACEQTASVMRRNRETLVTLLEAFTYDPLLNWAAEQADSAVRREMDSSARLALFAIHVQEMEGFLRQARDATAQACEGMLVSLQELARICMLYTTASRDVADASAASVAATTQDLEPSMRMTSCASTLQRLSRTMDEAHGQHRRLLGELKSFCDEKCAGQIKIAVETINSLRVGLPQQLAQKLAALTLEQHGVSSDFNTIVSLHTEVFKEPPSRPTSSLPPVSAIHELRELARSVDTRMQETVRQVAVKVTRGCDALQTYQDHLTALNILDQYADRSCTSEWTSLVSALTREGDVATFVLGARGMQAAASVATQAYSCINHGLGAGQAERGERCVASMVALQAIGSVARQLHSSVCAIVEAAQDISSKLCDSFGEELYSAARLHRTAALQLVIELKGDCKANDLLCHGEDPRWKLVATCDSLFTQLELACCTLSDACNKSGAPITDKAGGKEGFLAVKLELICDTLGHFLNDSRPDEMEGPTRELLAARVFEFQHKVEHRVLDFVAPYLVRIVQWILSELSQISAQSQADSAGGVLMRLCVPDSVHLHHVCEQQHNALKDAWEPVCNAQTHRLSNLSMLGAVFNGLHQSMERETAVLQWLNDGALRSFAERNNRTPFTAPRHQLIAPIQAIAGDFSALQRQCVELRESVSELGRRSTGILRKLSEHKDLVDVLKHHACAQAKRHAWIKSISTALQRLSEIVCGVVMIEDTTTAMRGHSKSVAQLDSCAAELAASFDRTLVVIAYTAEQQRFAREGDRREKQQLKRFEIDARNAPMRLEAAQERERELAAEVCLRFDAALLTIQEVLDANKLWDTVRGTAQQPDIDGGLGSQPLKVVVHTITQDILNVVGTGANAKGIQQLHASSKQCRASFEQFFADMSRMMKTIGDAVQLHRVKKQQKWTTTEIVELAISSAQGLLEQLLERHGEFGAAMRKIVATGDAALEQLCAMSLSAEALVVPCSADVKLGADKSCAFDEEGESASGAIDRKASVLQGRSAYALHLIRQVKGKLDGHADCTTVRRSGRSARGQPITNANTDANANASASAKRNKLTVPEQVELLIQQATAEENLCVMFEGWAPWM